MAAENVFKGQIAPLTHVGVASSLAHNDELPPNAEEQASILSQITFVLSTSPSLFLLFSESFIKV